MDLSAFASHVLACSAAGIDLWESSFVGPDLIAGTEFHSHDSDGDLGSGGGIKLFAEPFSPHFLWPDAVIWDSVGTVGVCRAKP